MKKFLTLLVAVVLSLNIKAQCPLTEAVDFYAVDDLGTKVHLFEILDRGQFAFIYFFFTDAADSELVDPYIAVAYEELGANQDEVYFIGVTPVNDSMAADGWKIEYGPDFPILHKFTEGSTAVDICDDYQIKLFPTSILIAPDRKIVVNNIWPPTSLDNILNPILSAISNYGGGENGGGENVGEIVKNDINIYPNPATKDFKVNVNGNANVMIYDMTGRCVKEVNVDNNTTINIEDLNTGVYFVNVNGKVEKLVVK